MICPLHVFMFVPELPELPDNLVVPAGLPVNGKQQGIEREHGPEQYSESVSMI
jgi:hypothetical protein